LGGAGGGEGGKAVVFRIGLAKKGKTEETTISPLLVIKLKTISLFVSNLFNSAFDKGSPLVEINEAVCATLNALIEPCLFFIVNVSPVIEVISPVTEALIVLKNELSLFVVVEETDNLGFNL
jgi:hypothetical protein